jgi:hypothetical protein
MFAPWVVIYAYMRPDPNPTRAPGLTWRQLTPRHWSGTWETKSAAPSPATATAGSPTCGSRTRPASHPSPPSAASPPSTRHRSRPTRCGRPGKPPGPRGGPVCLEVVRVATPSGRAEGPLVSPVHPRGPLCVGGPPGGSSPPAGRLASGVAADRHRASPSRCPILREGAVTCLSGWGVTGDEPDAISVLTAQTGAEPPRGAGVGTSRGTAGVPGSARDCNRGSVSSPGDYVREGRPGGVTLPSFASLSGRVLDSCWRWLP